MFNERNRDGCCAAMRSGIRSIANSPAEGERQQYQDKALHWIVSKSVLRFHNCSIRSSQQRRSVNCSSVSLLASRKFFGSETMKIKLVLFGIRFSSQSLSLLIMLGKIRTG
jgi:hypothetical protein